MEFVGTRRADRRTVFPALDARALMASMKTRSFASSFEFRLAQSWLAKLKAEGPDWTVSCTWRDRARRRSSLGSQTDASEEVHENSNGFYRVERQRPPSCCVQICGLFNDSRKI